MNQMRFWGLIAILAGCIAALAGFSGEYPKIIAYPSFLGGICWIGIGIFWMIKG